MFRTLQTRISLSEYEVHQALHSISAHRFMTLNLAYCKPVSEEEEDEVEYDHDSLSTSYTRSSSAGYTMSEHDRYACEFLKRYRDTEIYVTSSTSDSDDLPEYSAGPPAILNTCSVNHGESYHTEGAYHTVIETTDSQGSSTPPIESSTQTSPPATVIVSPRSPESTPRARRANRMHRSDRYGIYPVLQVHVPSIFERISDIFFSDIMSESARFHELAWQTGKPVQLLRDTYSRLPLRRDQQANWSGHMLAEPPKEKSSRDAKADFANWSEENTHPIIHRRPAKTSLVLEAIDQNDEEVEER